MIKETIMQGKLRSMTDDEKEIMFLRSELRIQNSLIELLTKRVKALEEKA